jgi:hypothetical protein
LTIVFSFSIYIFEMRRGANRLFKLIGGGDFFIFS